MLLYKRTVPVPGFVMTVLIYMYGQVKERSNLPRFPTCHDRHSTVVLNAVPSSRCRSARLAASLAAVGHRPVFTGLVDIATVGPSCGRLSSPARSSLPASNRGMIYTKSFNSGICLTFATHFVPDRVHTAYYVYLSHLAESTLPMCCINAILVYRKHGARLQSPRESACDC